MRVLGNQSGVSKIKVLLILAILGGAFHVGVKHLAVQLDYKRMFDAMKAKAAAAQVLKDEEIFRELEQRAAELGLPLKRENFILVRDEERRRMSIKTAWIVEVHYFGGICGEQCIQTYTFEPVADEVYSTR